MGEPAYNLPEEDQPDIEPEFNESRPSFGIYDGGGETTERSRGHLRSVGNNETEAEKEERSRLGLTGNKGDATDEDKAPKQGAASGSAGSAASAALSMAASGTQAGRLAKAANFFWGSKRRRRNTVIGGTGAGTVMGIIVGFMLMMAPLKVVSMFQNLQDHFFGASEQAVGDMTEKLMQHYLVKKVMPGMVDNKCTSTKVSKSCARVSDSSTPVGQLFAAWKDARLENKLANDYGIEIIRENRGGRNQFYLKTPNISNRISLGEFSETASFNNETFARLNRSDIRREVKVAMSNETLWRQMMHRHSVGKLLEDKYGVRRCIIACATRDKYNEKVDVKKAAFKSYLNERVIAPRSELYSLAIDCAISGLDCAGNVETDEDGRVTNEFERSVRDKLIDMRSRYSDSDLEKVYSESEDMRKKGIGQHLLAKLVGETTAKVTLKGIPIVGWVDLGAKLVSGMQNAQLALKRMNYSMYAATAVSTYALYRTSADEIRTGKVDAAIVGSVADSLNAVDGGKSAEQTSMYQSLSGKSDASKVAEDTPKELKLGVGGILGTAAAVVNFNANSPMMQPIGMTADLWNDTIGKVLDALGGLIGALLGEIMDAVMAVLRATPLGPIIDRGEELYGRIIESVIGYIFPSPFGDNPGGDRNFLVSAAGADFAANDHAHYTLGGRVLSPAESQSLQARANQERQDEFDNMSLYAKVFDTSNTASMISRVAMAAPTSLASGLASLTGGIGSLIPTPASISSLFDGKSSAVTIETEDPYGISQYGYTEKDIEAIGDPDTYWKQNCSNIEEVNKKWGAPAQEESMGLSPIVHGELGQAVLNDETGQYENYTTNPCKLLQAGVMAAGGKYDTSLLPETNSEGEVGSGTSTGGTFTIATYNILHAEHHTGTSRELGGCNRNPSPDDPYCAKARTEMQARIVTGKADNPAFDVFGTQETSPTQYRLLKQTLTDYNVFPENADRMNNKDDGAVAVFWNKNKFKKFASGKYTGRSNVYQKITNPWVGLETLPTNGQPGGQRFYVTSIHYATSKYGGTPEHIRISSDLTIDWVKSVASDGNPVFVVGDFNDRLPEKLSYCVFTRNAVMQNTWDMSNGLKANPDRPCPTNKENGIDQIYATPEGVTAENWRHIRKEGIYRMASDHTPVYTTITIQGETDGWVWPATKIYQGPCWNTLVSGQYHAGMDMNTRSHGIKARAAHAGTVYRTGYDGAAGNYITVKVSNKLYYSYEHLASRSRLNPGDSVVAGQDLGTIGQTGNVNLSSSVGHLHMVVSVDGELGGYSSSPQTGSNTRDPLDYLPKSKPNGYSCSR